MAKYGAPLMVDVIRGKLGGVVFTKARSSPTIRVRVRPANPRSATQTTVRASLVNAARQFKGLSTADAAAWNSAAGGLVLPNKVGGTFVPSGINYYVQLAAVYMLATPGGTPPVTPPASAFGGDTITVAGAGAAASVTFTASGANAANVAVEMLAAPLLSANRKPQSSEYRVLGYHHFVGGALTQTFAKPAGYYSLAYRFVLTTTGQRGPLTVIGTFQAT